MPPSNDAASHRNHSHLRVFQKHYDVSVWTLKLSSFSRGFLIPSVSNRSHLLLRLFGEFFQGVELFLRVLFSSADQAYFSSPPFIPLLMGCLAATLRRIPYYMDIRDLYPEVYFTQGLLRENQLMGLSLKNLISFFYLNAERVFSVSKLGKKSILKLCPHAQVLCLRNGFDENIFFPVPQKEPLFSIVFHGNFGRVQNLKLLRRLMEACFEKEIPVQFLLWGDGPCLQEVISPPLPNMAYGGNLTTDQLREKLGKCHLGISVRSSDIVGDAGLPVKIFEYIGLGLPTLLIPSSELSEEIEKLGMGLSFQDYQEDKIIEWIRLMSARGQEYQNLCAQTLCYREEFTRQAQERILEKTLRQ